MANRIENTKNGVPQSKPQHPMVGGDKGSLPAPAPNRDLGGKNFYKELAAPGDTTIIGGGDNWAETVPFTRNPTLDPD